MPLHKNSGLTQLADNCFIHTEVIGGAELPRILVGEIHRQPTGGRDNPPDCISGFDTAYTPFAKGHIMALELGGADVSANIVPQYGMWQGMANGPWRMVEHAIGSGVAESMVVLLDYGVVAQSYMALSIRFRGGDKLFHWTDPRIPVRFRVWTTALVNVQPYLSASDADKPAAAEALTGALGAPTYDLAVNGMPDVDRTYWRTQMIQNAAREAHAAYRHGLTAQVLPPPGTGGPIRRQTRQRHNPMAVRPTAPLSFPAWIGQHANRTAVATALSNNIGGVSVGFSIAERQAVTAQVVDQAVFA